ncbi:hypothetical protein Tco_0195773 [Tanacetum coccineum]
MTTPHPTPFPATTPRARVFASFVLISDFDDEITTLPVRPAPPSPDRTPALYVYPLDSNNDSSDEDLSKTNKSLYTQIASTSIAHPPPTLSLPTSPAFARRSGKEISMPLGYRAAKDRWGTTSPSTCHPLLPSEIPSLSSPPSLLTSSSSPPPSLLPSSSCKRSRSPSPSLPSLVSPSPPIVVPPPQEHIESVGDDIKTLHASLASAIQKTMNLRARAGSLEQHDVVTRESLRIARGRIEMAELQSRAHDIEASFWDLERHLGPYIDILASFVASFGLYPTKLEYYSTIAIYEAKTCLARDLMNRIEQQKDNVANNASNKRKWEGDHGGSSSQNKGQRKYQDMVANGGVRESIGERWECVSEWQPGSHEIKKLETELWNHAMVGAGHATYTDRFHELARLTPHLVTPEIRMIKRYMYGLAPQIRGMVAAMKPKTIQKGIATHAFNCNCPGQLAKDYRGCTRNVNTVNAEKPNCLGHVIEEGRRNLGNHARGTRCRVFDNDMRIPFGHGSFDMIIEKARLLMSAKASEKKQEEIVVVRDFHEVFPDDLSGLLPIQEIDFPIELTPRAMPVAKSPNHLAHSELEELSGQLKELQDKVKVCTIEIYTILTHDKTNFSKANVVADALSRKERVKPKRVRAMNMILQSSIKDRILAAQKEAVDESVGLKKGLDEMIEHRSDGTLYYLDRT